MIFAPLLTLMGKRELVAFLKPAFLMSCDSQCCVALPQCAKLVGLQCLIVVFRVHTHLFFNTFFWHTGYTHI